MTAETVTSGSFGKGRTVTDYPVRGPVIQSLSSQQIDGRNRAYMEWALLKLREANLETLASGTGDYDKAADRLETMRPGLARFHSALARDASTYLHWRRGMEVYDVHPAMTASLMRMGSKSKIPGSIFRRLRHLNPYFSIRGTVPVVHGEGDPGRIFGFYAVGAISGKYPLVPGINPPDHVVTTHAGYPATLLDTYDKAANALQVTITSEVLERSQRNVIDLDMCRLVLPMTKDFTLEELVEEVASSGFSWWQPGTGTARPSREKIERPYLTTMAKTAISHLLYACSRTVEITDPPVRGSDIKRKKGKAKPAKQRSRIHPVGYRMGAAIEDSVRRAQQQQRADEPTEATGRKMPPHIRAPHSHLYWVGPGRQEAEIKFLDQIPVNIGGEEPEAITLHPMK